MVENLCLFDSVVLKTSDKRFSDLFRFTEPQILKAFLHVL